MLQCPVSLRTHAISAACAAVQIFRRSIMMSLALGRLPPFCMALHMLTLRAGISAGSQRPLVVIHHPPRLFVQRELPLDALASIQSPSGDVDHRPSAGAAALSDNAAASSGLTTKPVSPSTIASRAPPKARRHHRRSRRHRFQHDRRKRIQVYRGHSHHISQLISRAQFLAAQPAADAHIRGRNCANSAGICESMSRDVKTSKRRCGSAACMSVEGAHKSAASPSRRSSALRSESRACPPDQAAAADLSTTGSATGAHSSRSMPLCTTSTGGMSLSMKASASAWLGTVRICACRSIAR